MSAALCLSADAYAFDDKVSTLFLDCQPAKEIVYTAVQDSLRFLWPFCFGSAGVMAALDAFPPCVCLHAACSFGFLGRHFQDDVLGLFHYRIAVNKPSHLTVSIG